MFWKTADSQSADERFQLKDVLAGNRAKSNSSWLIYVDSLQFVLAPSVGTVTDRCHLYVCLSCVCPQWCQQIW